ncbi:hypothetical protein IW261DRAFT_1416438 [Armillaria novae-zelandiae]|uniref:Uncharacterized protein n=1 Tax=Armillaria novae-zelandiae TaxID=153914 RepID=A0AA39TET0_9AGAR|nr:hypothetical protein IW261DRAFT_1416438 [Armillaria novae-zelandiae]
MPPAATAKYAPFSYIHSWSMGFRFKDRSPEIGAQATFGALSFQGPVWPIYFGDGRPVYSVRMDINSERKRLASLACGFQDAQGCQSAEMVNYSRDSDTYHVQFKLFLEGGIPFGEWKHAALVCPGDPTYPVKAGVCGGSLKWTPIGVHTSRRVQKTGYMQVLDPYIRRIVDRWSRRRPVTCTEIQSQSLWYSREPGGEIYRAVRRLVSRITELRKEDWAENERLSIAGTKESGSTKKEIDVRGKERLVHGSEDALVTRRR